MHSYNELRAHEMATSRSREDILKNLDSILADIRWKGPPSDISHLQSPTHLKSFKKLGNQDEVTSQRIITQTLTHSRKLGGQIFRVCSIGCEDGLLDKAILEEVIKETEVEYVGLDNDDQLVETALEELDGIAANINVSITTVDYEDQEALKQLNLGEFDVIWMVNCTYSTLSLSSLLQGALNLLKPSGIMLIVSSSKESIEELVTRFWAHQRQDQLHTTESVIAALAELGLAYHVNKEPITLDLTVHFGESFESKESELVLDHLMLCRLTDYPPQVRELVIDFLQSIAVKCKIVSLSDLIQVHKM